MSKQENHTGRCLCGAIVVEAPSRSHEVGACHCGMCRRWGGSALLAQDCGSDVRFQGEEHIGLYDSSDWAQRGFCNQCGTYLFYRLKQTGQTIMPVGLFYSQDDLVFDHQIFIDRKPGYDAFANETRDLTEAEVFAMYAPPEN